MSDDETVACDAKPASPFVFGSGATPSNSPAFVFGSGAPTPTSPDSPFAFGASSPATPAFSFSAPPPTRPLTAPVLRLNRGAAPAVPPVPAEDETDATPVGLATLPRDILATILAFFRTAQIRTVRGLLLDTTVKHAERYPRYGFFVEAKSELATVLAFATCNRATHAAGLSDAVWAAHCRSIEVQLPAAELIVWKADTRVLSPSLPLSDTRSIEVQKSWADHQAARREKGQLPFPEAYADPRLVEPDVYQFQSEFERYRTLRMYYDRVCARFEAMVDPTTWSDADRQRLEEASSYCSDVVRQTATHSRQHWRPSNAITEEEELDALDRCTPANVAHTCIHGFAIKTFQLYGMRFLAYKLIDVGLVGFSPLEHDDIRAAFVQFLARLTSNAKFDRHAPSYAE